MRSRKAQGEKTGSRILRRQQLPTLILLAVFCGGIFLLLYPTVSDYWNSIHQSQAVSSYVENVTEIDNEEYGEILEAAEEYNREIFSGGARWNMTEAEKKEYEKQLDVSGSGVMGYIEIPQLRCRLPVYHGTDPEVLQVAIGHIEGSSLPVGGKNTHCVLSGHRGLPSAKLFSELDKLAEGDLFILGVLDETLTYEVDQIRIVEPQDLSELEVKEGMDYCTLVTCTPYGVNSHRLLVRGHRVENERSGAAVRVTADAIQVEPVQVAPLVAAPMLAVLLIWMLVKTRRKKGAKADET